MADAIDESVIEWKEGAALPGYALPPITRAMLALYAGGSGDHNPLHIDIDFARSVAKMDDVIGHGMLTMALVGRYVTSLVPQSALHSYSVRFTGMSKVGDRLECSGRVTKVFGNNGARCAEIELKAARPGGEALITGVAVVVINEEIVRSGDPGSLLGPLRCPRPLRARMGHATARTY